MRRRITFVLVKLKVFFHNNAWTAFKSVEQATLKTRRPSSGNASSQQQLKNYKPVSLLLEIKTPQRTCPAATAVLGTTAVATVAVNTRGRKTCRIAQGLYKRFFITKVTYASCLLSRDTHYEAGVALVAGVQGWWWVCVIITAFPNNGGSPDS